MKFLIVAALAVAVSAYTHVNSRTVVDDALIADVNSKNAGWKAGHNKFSNYTVGDVKALLGTKLDGSLEGVEIVSHEGAAAPPASFDARQQWPGCIHPIRDQAQCGSCWAFGATEALSDRLCIVSKNATNVVLSPQQLVSCDNQDGNQGCNGGYPIKAWQYMQKTGVVADACYPYTSGGGVTGSCKWHGSTCPSGSSSATVYHAKSAYAVAQSVTAIQTEIMTNGPVEAAFEVYQDFFSYTGGVYKHVSGGLDGGHAIKIIGWGVDGTTPYWLVANSWGTSWGLNGFFMILRGANECGIEAGVVAGLG